MNTQHIYIYFLFAIQVGIFCLPYPHNACAAPFPQELQKIERPDADYNTPEGTYTSFLSAMLTEDVDWYYETLSEASANLEKSRAAEYGSELQQRRYAVYKATKKVTLIDKQPHNNGVYLLVKFINKDGSTFQAPSLLIEENGLWKIQKTVPENDPILDLIIYTPPPPI